ncbi:MAG TPA: hypothetical protein V6D25_07540 [Leptolyngbyaceae cyanobacterium]
MVKGVFWRFFIPHHQPSELITDLNSQQNKWHSDRVITNLANDDVSIFRYVCDLCHRPLIIP